MVQHCKYKKIFLGIIAFVAFWTLEVTASIQSMKIINKMNAEVSCTFNIPANMVAYMHLVSTECPRACITAWNPGTYGNYPGCDYQKPKLPIWVRIGFDRDVQQSFIDEFFIILRSVNAIFKTINPIRHKKFTKEFVITVGGYYTYAEIESLINLVNISMYKKSLMKLSKSIF